ncbi:MAG: ABC transporter substrate-binding protein [Candidatus Cloacimonetes bacterium]|nr:ABC transporter substrate-binding protein [Candidatus Cloacimonadota bacterium]
MKARLVVAIFSVAVLLAYGVIGGCKRSDAGANHKEDHGSLKSSTDSMLKLRYRPKWQPQAQFAGFYMAKKMGFYEQHGLDVQVQNTLGGNQPVEQLLAGNGDVVHLDLLSAMSINKDSTVVVCIGQISQNSAIQLVGRKSRGIRSVEDFKGKKLGLWRSGSNLIVRAYLQHLGIEMEVIPMEWSVHIFTENMVDVVSVMHYNEYHQLLQAGIPEEDLFVLSFDDAKHNIPDEGLYVLKEFYNKHQKECEAFTEATIDGWTYAFTHPEESVEEVIRLMNETKLRANTAHQRWMLDKMRHVIIPEPESFGILQRSDFDNAQSVLKKMGILQRNISYEEFYPRATR